MGNTPAAGAGERSRRGRRRSDRSRGSSNASNRNSGRSPRVRSSGGRGKRSTTASTSSLWEKLVAFFTGGAKSSSSANGNGAGSKSKSRSRASATASAPKDIAVSDAARNKAPKEARTPENVEVTSARLYVGNLSYDATESDLVDLFNGVGSVQNAEVVSHRYTQRSKGFAFVQMQTIDEARRAVHELHDKEFLGRKLVVSGAKSPKQTDSSDEDAAA